MVNLGLMLAIIRYILCLPFNIAFVFLAWFLSFWLLAPISMLTGPVLPLGLQYFSVLDDTLDGGQRQHPELYPAGVKGVALYWQRVCWICRNPAQGLQSRLLGFPAAGMTFVSVGPRLTIMKSARGFVYFSFRINVPKIWFGWNPKAYDGVNCHYEFQPFGGFGG